MPKYIIAALLVGLLLGWYLKPQEWEKQDIEEYQSYCESFKGGEFYRLNGYPACSIQEKPY